MATKMAAKMVKTVNINRNSVSNHLKLSHFDFRFAIVHLKHLKKILLQYAYVESNLEYAQLMFSTQYTHYL